MKTAKILFIILIAFFSVPLTVNAATVEVLLDDSFDGTPWDDNWANGGWIQESTYVNTAPFSAKADSSNQGYFTSTSMDMSDASSIQVEFAHRHYNGDSNDFNVEYWDGTQYNPITTLSNPAVHLTQVWYDYSDTITDPSYLISDFHIRFTTNLVPDHRAYLDDVHVSKTIGYSITYDIIGEGSIHANPSGPYDLDQVVSLQAVPSGGSKFVSWGGDATGTALSVDITIDGDKSVTANFAPIGIKTSLSTSYNRGNILSLTIYDGVPNDPVMIQVESLSEVKLIDQRNLDSSGYYIYSIIIPLTWEDSTYTLYVKDPLSSSSKTFTIPIPPVLPPPSGGGSSGGGSTVPPSPIVIALLSPKDAAKELDDWTPRQVAKVLMEIEDQKHISLILDYFSTTYTREVLTNMTSGKSGELLNLLNQTKTVEIVSKLKEEDFEIVEEMIDDDLNNSAIVIEIIVKNKINGLNQAERKEALEKFTSMLSNLDRETLLKTFIEIAKLPETPSTVAYIIEAMELSPVIDVMNYWLDAEYYSDSKAELELIFSYFSTGLLGDIYTGVSDSARLNLFDLLPDTIIQDFPEIGVFSVSELSISFDEFELGQTIVISYLIENIGEKVDQYLIPVKINGETVFTDKGILVPGTSTTIEHSHTPALVGPYVVDIIGELVNYLVNEVQSILPPLTPAQFILTSLQVVPRQLFSGEYASVFISIENIGEENGMDTFHLKIDSVEVDSKDVFLPGGQSTTVLYDITMDYEVGQHIIVVGHLTETFEIIVESGSTGIPWFSVFAVLVVISAGVYYAIRENLIDLKEIQKSLGFK